MSLSSAMLGTGWFGRRWLSGRRLGLLASRVCVLERMVGAGWKLRKALLGAVALVLCLLPLPAWGAGADLEAALSQLFERVKPAVVNITSFRPYRPLVISGPGGNEVRRMSYRRLRASGVVVGGRYVVTTVSVAQAGDSILVRFPGGEAVAATYLGMDPSTHVAALLLDGEGPYPSLEVGDGEPGALPEWVAAVAYGPWRDRTELEPVLTLSQSEAVETVRVRCSDSLETVWRIGGPFVPGNGGGALVDLDGRWLGLIAGVVAGGDRLSNEVGWKEGIIVPARAAVRVLDEGHRRGGGFLGVRARRLREGPESTGVVVAGIFPGSPAERYGIRKGDVLLRFDGQQIESTDHLTQLVLSKPPGAPVRIDLRRGARLLSIELKLGDRRAVSVYAREGMRAVKESRSAAQSRMRMGPGAQ